MNIEKIKKEDINQIIEICLYVKQFHTTDEPEFWTKEVLEKWVSSDSDITLMIKEEDKIIGFALVAVHLPTSKATFEISGLMTHIESRG